jgi:hypothetical protein
MNPWIAKAEHALRTNQPNLAVLYMRRGLRENPDGRLWLFWHDFNKALREVGRTISTVWEAAADAFLGPQTQDEYALIGAPCHVCAGIDPDCAECELYR